MKLAMQIMSSDKTVRSNTVQQLKYFNSQSSITKAKKGDQLVSVMPASNKAFDLMGDDMVEISTENRTSKKIGSYDEKMLEEPKAKLSK